MSLAALATVLVTVAFVALVVWVLLPRNRERLERHGRIPLDAKDQEQRGGDE